MKGPPWPRFAGPDEGQLWLAWLIRLRWVAILAQVVVVGFTFEFLPPPALPWMAGIVAVLVAANLGAMRERRDRVPPEGLLLVQLVIDVLALTGFLVLSGGHGNPFTALFLIHVAMGAVMLSPRRATALAVIVGGCYALLFTTRWRLDLSGHAVSEQTLMQVGQVAAFAITVVAILAFVLGVANSLRAHRQQLLEARDRTARTDRLRSVGALAAGAAHHINTPLNTITLRLSRLARRHTDDASRGDLDVIRDQVERCKVVVEQLLQGAGDPSASGLDHCHVGQLADETVHLWRQGAGVDVTFDDSSEDATIEVPRVAFAHALINLLENAREAQAESGADSPIDVRVRRLLDRVEIDVADQGVGMPLRPDQVGEPFYTTKPSGTGLGVYVARVVADGAGGGLRYAANGPQGTVATWWFPVAGQTAT